MKKNRQEIQRLTDEMIARRLSRRQFLTRTAALGLALTSASAFIAACGPEAPAPAEEEAPAAAGDSGAASSSGAPGKVVWVSPRGTLEVMDDFPIWVAKDQGYFADLNIEVEMQAGPLEALAVTKLVAENQADIGFPSPGVLLSSIDAGMPLMMSWGMITGQTFDFALPADSDITSVQELEGKTIALGSEGWSVIVDPILVEAGVDPESVTYVNAGNQWGQSVSLGQADAALAWRGLQAQWTAQGLDLNFLIGNTFSDHPSNGYCTRQADLEDETKADILTRFFRGLCMGFEFTYNNPRAGAQITYNQFPALQEQMEPQLALDSMLELGTLYYENRRNGQPYGLQDMDAWQIYIDTVFGLGQIENQYEAENVVSNFFVEPANQFDAEQTKADAEAFQLSDDFKDLAINYEI